VCFSVPTREHSFASILASPNSIYIKFDHWCDVTTTTSERRRNNVVFATSITRYQSERRRNNVDYTTSIIRREGDVETMSIFSRSTSRLHFDVKTTSCVGWVYGVSANKSIILASTKLIPRTGYEKLFQTLCKLQIKRLGLVISLA
jgi:hypothetical protein